MQSELFPGLPEVKSPELASREAVKAETLAAKKKRVCIAWNRYAKDPDMFWIPVRKIPEGETGRLLTGRVRDQWWMDRFEKGLDALSRLDWYRRGKNGQEPRRLALLTFLRPDALRKILDGEWGTPAKPEEQEGVLDVPQERKRT
jgi:hypothetical protein